MTATDTLTPALWLQRHAQPLVAPGVCYGRSNMAADNKATDTAAQDLLTAWQAEMASPATLWHSPLQRCEQLARSIQTLTPGSMLKPMPELAEMDFGAWEGLRWDDIPRAEIDAWTADFWRHAPGGGEPLVQMMVRVETALAEARTQALASNQSILWITHAGVVQCAHWLVTRGQRQPSARDWPSVKLAYGDWLRLPLR